jgi:spermidine synthase
MLLQAGLCVYSVAMLPVFSILSGPHSAVKSWIGSNIVFAVLPLASGFLGGYLFPLANKIFLGKRRDAGSSGGAIYGLDLLGACAGALLVGTFMIPVAGIPATCFMTAALNAAAIFVSAVSRKDKG